MHVNALHRMPLVLKIKVVSAFMQWVLHSVALILLLSAILLRPTLLHSEKVASEHLVTPTSLKCYLFLTVN